MRQKCPYVNKTLVKSRLEIEEDGPFMKIPVKDTKITTSMILNVYSNAFFLTNIIFLWAKTVHQKTAIFMIVILNVQQDVHVDSYNQSKQTIIFNFQKSKRVWTKFLIQLIAI